MKQLAEEISIMVPEARILVGHGQMKEHQLEQIMMDFIDYQADVLVCTTIIETGLDISNANTMIVDEADKMGLGAAISAARQGRPQQPHCLRLSDL